MPARKPPKRLFKSSEVVHAYQHDRQTHLGSKQMMREHTDVLQNIEFALVTTARQDDHVDDRLIHQALGLAMGRNPGTEDVNPLAEDLADDVSAMRGIREDVSDAVWNAGLKTVRESVERHSSLLPGQKAYIRFVSQYVK